MGKFRRTPKVVEIEAVQLEWSTWSEMCEHLSEWGHDFDEFPGLPPSSEDPDAISIKVRTAQQQIVTVNRGEWIVRDVDRGTFYPIRDDVFQDTYEAIV